MCIRDSARPESAGWGRQQRPTGPRRLTGRMVARLLRRQPHVRVGCTAVLTPPGSSGFPSRAGDSTNRQTPLRRRDLRIRVGDGPWVTCTTSPISIGRDPNVTIVIDDDRVSRRHAELRWTNSGWRLIDVGSRNGTWRDGRRSAEEAVASALQVRLGAVSYTHLRAHETRHDLVCRLL